MQGTPERAAAWLDLWPAAVILLAAFLLEWLDIDRAIARAWAYGSVTQGWLGSGAGDWWARGLIHQAGRWLVRCVAAAGLVTWALSFRLPAWAPWRREALYVFLGMVLVTATVGILKLVTNVDCPWDIAGFGGNRPYVTLFADRPDYLPAARCFPGAHSSSGFALLSLYFALRRRRPQLARWAAAFAGSVGVLFAFGQEARGAHFLSHDLVSVALAWCLLRALDRRMLAARAPAAALAGSGQRWRRFLPGYSGAALQQQPRQEVCAHAACQAAEDVARPE